MKAIRRLILATIVGAMLAIPAVPTFAANQNGTNQNGNPQQSCQNGTVVNGVCVK